MERSVTVRTPEAIAFYYELAGLGSRFLALLIDTVIQTVIFGVIFIAGVVGAARALALATALHISPKDVGSTVLAITITLVFIIYYGYFVFFEKLWNGQTPGKKLLGIRVVRDGGYPVQLMDSIIRNLVRVLEFTLGFYFLSALSMLVSSENKRLGDYAAGTIVVRDRGMEVRDPKSWMRPEPASSAVSNGAFASLSADELALVDRYVARKTQLNPKAAQETARKIALAIRPKLGPEFAGLTDDELLMRIVARRPS